MLYSLSYFDEATLDVKEAKAWYKDQQDGLEKRFATAIKVAILKLHTSPGMYGIRYKNIRIAHPKIFPYSIHFYIDDVNRQIVIIAIVHNKRHPDVAGSRI